MPKRTKVLKKTKQPLRWPIILCISIVMFAFIFSTASAQTLLMRQSPQCDGLVECSKLFFSSLWSTLTGSPIAPTQAAVPTPVPPPGPENQSAVGVVTVGNTQKLLKVEEIYDYGDAEGTRMLNGGGSGPERKDLILQPMGDGSVGIGGTPSDMYRLDVFGPAHAKRFEGEQLDITGQARVGNLEATTGIQTSMLCLGGTTKDCLSNVMDFGPWKSVDSGISFSGFFVKKGDGGNNSTNLQNCSCTTELSCGEKFLPQSSDTSDSCYASNNSTGKIYERSDDVIINGGKIRIGSEGNPSNDSVPKFKVAGDQVFNINTKGLSEISLMDSRDGSQRGVVKLDRQYFNQVTVGDFVEIGSVNARSGRRRVVEKYDINNNTALIVDSKFDDNLTANQMGVWPAVANFTTSSGYSLLFIDHFGNVGIGTGTPQAPLHVNGKNNYGIAIAKGSAGGNTIDGTVNNDVSAPLYLNAISGKDIYMVPGGGNVGIGTDAPVGKLHVAGKKYVLDRNEGAPPSGMDSCGNFNDANTKAINYRCVSVYQSGPSSISYRIMKVILADHLMVQQGGNVGIGTTTPNDKLTIQLPALSTKQEGMSIDVDSFGNSANAQNSYYFRTRDLGANSTAFYIRGDGNVGIGTASPGASLQIANTTREIKDTCSGTWERNRDVSAIRFKDNPAGVSGGGCGADLAYIAYVSKGQTDRTVLKIVAGNDPRDDRRIEDDIALMPSGNVGIGFEDPEFKLDVFGDINVRSNAPAGSRTSLDKSRQLALAKERIGFDVAELFDAEEPVEAGDVLVVGSKERMLKKSSKPYQGTIVGVVSGAPAILFEGSQLKMGTTQKGSDNQRKPAVALAGKVPVKVSLENGLIEVGDYLTTSNIPGMAMKAIKHGMTLGIALENYNGKGKNEVLVFLSIKETNTFNIIEKLLDRIERLEKNLKKK